MQVTQTIVAAPVVNVAITGARIGDKVLFSSHHPKNIKEKPWMNAKFITFDKLYTIEEINSVGLTSFKDDDGQLMTWGAASYKIGHYDIIERAPQPEPVKPAFQPVILTLETPQEVRFIAELLGSTGGSRQGDLNIYRDVYSPLKAICETQCGGYTNNSFEVSQN